MFDLESVGLGRQEFQAPNSLRDVPHSNCDLVVLVGLNILKEDLRWEYFDRLGSITQMINRCAV